MSVILWKFFISLVFLMMFVIGAFLGWRVLDLMKRVKQAQKNWDYALREWHKTQREKPNLSELDKKMILNALQMPEYNKAITEPSTHHHVRKSCGELKDKIKESLKD